MPVNTVPLINGIAYDFAQVVVNILGVPIMGVKSIKYKQERTTENNYGAGHLPVSRGRGTTKAEAQIEISMSDVERLRDVAPGGDLLNLPPFPITVSYLNAQKPVTHVLHNVQFLDDGVEGAIDDTDLTREFGLLPSNITYR